MPVSPNPIVVENNIRDHSVGTEWQLDNPTRPADRDEDTLRTAVIEGYASLTSVNIGELIQFMVSTTAQTFQMDIYRMGYYGGDGGRLMATFAGLPGENQPTPPKDPHNDNLLDCAWNAVPLPNAPDGRLVIPVDWVSGVYVAKLTEASTNKQSYIIFVVRDDAREADFLVQCSATTWQAYNGWGGWSNYRYNCRPALDVNPDFARLTFNRPYMASSDDDQRYGNGAGHFFTNDKPNHDSGEGGLPGTTAGWEYNMVRWLEKEGYNVTYCTSIDLHRDPNLLPSRRYRGFISMGHDEYWSRETRLSVEAARDLGVNLAFFSGNTAWNCVRLENDARGNPLRTMVCHDFAPHVDISPPSIAGNFRQIGWFEEPLIAGSWGGSGDDDFIVMHCPAWLSAGTQLTQGGVLGTRLAGYEWNGFDRAGEASWERVPSGTVIAFQNQSKPASAFSMLYTSQISGATVFNGASVHWSWGLDEFTVPGVQEISPSRQARVSADVQQVTRNVLSRFFDSTRMVDDLQSGEYRIRSVSANQSLIVGNNGDPDGPVEVFGDPGWVPTNDQATWIIEPYPYGRTGTFGPYKGASDTWYTIRNKQNGQSLIVSNGGNPGGPVIVIGDQTGHWGEISDNLQKLWRIWRWTGSTRSGVYLFQNCASGQLLIVGNGGAPDSPVIVYGDNGGWGETEDNPQKLWDMSPARGRASR